MAGPLRAETVTASVTVGTSPIAVAVNPASGWVYVANNGSANVSAINGATHAASAIAAGTSPRAIAVNPATNRIYVANNGSANVTVIDGSDNSVVTTVAVASTPRAIAVNTATNKIYVANEGGDSVSVIDGATNTVVATPAVGDQPRAIAINPVTNRIYVANFNGDSVSVIDGATDTVSATITVGADPVDIAVNPATNKIYVANNTGDSVTVIDGATNFTTTIATGNDPEALVVNPVTNRIYVANDTANGVAVINGDTNSVITTVAVGTAPRAISLNPATNRIYTANFTGDNVTVIDGANNSVAATLTATNGTQAIAVNPATNQVYAANNLAVGGVYSVTVIDGATHAIGTIAAGTRPTAVSANPASNKIYVTNYTAGSVTAIDGATDATSTISVGASPRDIAVNAATNRIYVANEGSANVTVIDGAAGTVTASVAVGSGPRALAVNPATHRVYVANNFGNSVSAINGTTNAVAATIAVGTNPQAIAVNPASNRIYVANWGSANVTVVDGASHTVAATVAVGTSPRAIAINAATNRIYVANEDSDNVTVIDGSNNTVVTTVLVGDAPGAIVVNPVTNKIFVANNGSNNVTVIDGATNGVVATLAVGTGPSAVAVNPASNKIYVANYGSANVSVIGGIGTSVIATLSAGTNPNAAAVNPAGHKVYVANWGSNNVTTVTEKADEAIPLTVTVTPLSGNVTTSSTPTLTLTATSAFSPTAPPVRGVYFQVDSLQGTWSKATAAGGANWSASTASLTPGRHLLYAFAVDGQDASSINLSAPVLGRVAVYTFSVVAAPTATLSPSSLSFADQILSTASTAQTVTLSNNGGGTLNISAIELTGANAADFARTTACGATLAGGASCTISVTFTPSAAGARSASLSVSSDASGSPHSISLGGTGILSPAAVGLSPATLDFGSQTTSTTPAAKTTTLSNTGGSTLNISAISISGTNAADFARTTDCGATLAGGANCTISVTFTPSATGSRSANLSVSSDATGSPHVVALSGSGVSPPPPPLPPPPSPVPVPGDVTYQPVGSVTSVIQNAGSNVELSANGVLVVKPGIPTALLLNESAQANVLISLPSQETVSFVIGRSVLDFRSSNDTLLQVAKVNGATALRVVQGEARIAGTVSGQAMVAVGFHTALLTTEEVNTVVLVSREGEGWVVEVDQGKVSVQSEGQGDTTAVFSGELLNFGSRGELNAIQLGSKAGRHNHAGDPLDVLAVASGGQTTSLTIQPIIPNLNGSPARLGGQSLIDTIGAIVKGSGIQTSLGVLRLTFPGGVVANALPLGSIPIDVSRKDGMTVLANGNVEVVKSGIVVTFTPAVSDPGDFARRAAALNTQGSASSTLLSNGVLHTTIDGTLYILRPEWTVTLGGQGQAGFSIDATGRVVYRNAAGNVQVLNPVIADYARLASIVKSLDPNATLSDNGNGSATLRLPNATYKLLADYVLTQPTAEQMRWDWWSDGKGRIFVNNSDGKAQGFLVH
ncbi:MAG: choice-of-anchor D domain-containing protein [Betaproteobacteria bacterium]|nr:choice-of-anchor D domain-containing protein [Betaproteobacteria bacterium]